MSTATNRIIIPRALATRTILAVFSFPVRSCSEALAYVVFTIIIITNGTEHCDAATAACPQDTDTLALVGSCSRVKWTTGVCRLHGEDGDGRSFLIPSPTQTQSLPTDPPAPSAPPAAASHSDAAAPLQTAAPIKLMELVRKPAHTRARTHARTHTV